MAEDIESLMADARYGLATGLTREVLEKPEMRKVELTEKIDRIVLNRFLGIPIFLAAMWLVFKLTFDLSAPFGDWIDAMVTGPFKHWVAAVLGLLRRPGLDGVAGHRRHHRRRRLRVGLRAGHFRHDVLHHLPRGQRLHGPGGLRHGPGDARHRPARQVLHPHAARLRLQRPGHLRHPHPGEPARQGAHRPAHPADVLRGAAAGLRPVRRRLLRPAAGTVIWSIYVLGIALAIVMGLIFKKTLFRGETPMFIMELPPYRMPSFRSLCLHTWEKGKHFLIKAGTYILAVSVFVWFLLNLPWGMENKKDSYLGQAGQAIAPIFEPIGFGNWEAASSLITGIIAKEIVVGTMGEIYAPADTTGKNGVAPTLGEDLREMGTSFFGAVAGSRRQHRSPPSASPAWPPRMRGGLAAEGCRAAGFTPLTAYGFMAFVLLYMPCVVVAIAMRQEFGGWKWFGVAFVYQRALAWGVALIIYQGGTLSGLGG